MIDLTRRAVLLGISAAAAAPALASIPANAAAPQKPNQVTGFYRYKVGDIEVTVVSDGVNRFKLPDNMVGNVPKDQVEAALSAAHVEKGMFYNPYNPVILNTGSKLVLIDTGVGEAGFNQSKGAIGQFLNNAKAAGYEAKDFDAVIVSHYHGDHMNGLLRADNSLTFPNAEILVPAKEHAYWMDDGEMARAPKGRIEGLFKNSRRVFTADEVKKRTRTYEWDKEVIPGVTAVGTPGHSPGHTSHIVSSGNGKVYVQADVTHVPFLFVRNPGWHAMYDQDVAAAEVTRRKVYDMLAAEKMMVQGFHYPFPSHAYVEKSGTGYRETMVLWNPAI